MEVKTIYVNYDIRRMRPPNLIAFTHENDKNTQVIELHLTDRDEPMTLNTDYTYTAAIVNSDTKALINDSIDCELNEDGNVLIPIDDLHVRGRQSLKIELTVTDEQGEQVLSLPFPIWFKVSGSILDGAEVIPEESKGTVPELLEDAKEALDAVKTVSATVNQNGTITFEFADGRTVTTTGASVIGPQGPAGADGNDYVLTNQDKSDIADLVLAQLPTTQGVLYGNSND